MLGSDIDQTTPATSTGAEHHRFIDLMNSMDSVLTPDTPIIRAFTPHEPVFVADHGLL